MRRGDYGELSATARRMETSPQQVLQARRRREGLCAVCGKPRDQSSRDYCPTHLQHHRTWRRDYEAARRADGLCIKCPNESPDYRMCDACREKANKRRRRR